MSENTSNSEHKSGQYEEERVTRKLVSSPERKALRNKLEKLTPAQRVKILNSIQPRVVEKYMAHIPHPRQQVFLSLSNREVLFGGSGGGGKVLRMDEMILSQKGWVQNKDLKPGSMIVDPRTGGSQEVIATHAPERIKVVEVEFEDGTVIETSWDHLWTYRRSGMRTKGWERRVEMGHNDPWLNGYKVGTTKQLKEFLDSSRDKNDRGTAGNSTGHIHVPVAHPTVFTRGYRNINATLPIHPWLLGILLGDGHLESQTVTNPDTHIIDALYDLGKEIGFEISEYDDKHTRITKAPWLKDALIKLGLMGKLSHNKFIPTDYLFAPMEYRMKLMQGLMDSDGYIDDRGHMSYTTVSKRLADDFMHLARSLGSYARTTSKIPTYTYNGKKLKGQRAYTVYFTPHDPTDFATVPFKKDRIKKSQHQPALQIVDIREMNRYELMRCITVSGVDGLYITKNFVVTHNSDALLMSALQYCDVPGYSALLLRTTWPDLNKAGAILDRANQWFGGTDARKREGGRIWEFPTVDPDGNEALPARISFGYLDKENDKYKLQCFTPDHDILTKSGWVPVNEVTTDDLVASVDPETELMSWEKVSATHKYHHRGAIVDIYQQRGVSMRVTPNHKLWIKKPGELGLVPIRADEIDANTRIPMVVTQRPNRFNRFKPEYVMELARRDYNAYRVSDVVKSFAEDNARLYMDTISHKHTEHRRRISIPDEKKRYIDDLMYIGVLAGLKCTLGNAVIGTKGGSRRELSWPSNVTKRYAILKNACAHPDEKNYVRMVSYNGKVYCVSTPRYQTLVVRHRGRVHVSGNSAEYQFIGFDELTQFNPAVYTYSFSRLRKPDVSCINCYRPMKMIKGNWVHSKPDQSCAKPVPDPMVIKQYKPAPDGTTIFDVPLRVRGATNPGGRAHEYVRNRFVDPKTRDERSLFVPSSIHDNPSLNYDEYVESLSYLDPIERARMLNGDWDVAEMGEMFKREWFKHLNVSQEPQGRAVRFWDNASSEGKGDYTVGAKMIMTKDNQFVIADIVRGQWSTHEKKRVMAQTAQMDGTSVAQRMEQEPGSSGVDVIDDMRRNVFLGYDFSGIRSTGDKITRATPFASAVEGGLVYLLPGQWNKKYIDELIQVPNGPNDDQLDATASAYNFLAGGRRVRLLV